MTSKFDHFIPGFAVDTNTQGARRTPRADLLLYPNGGCTTCNLYTGYISSGDGGSTWTKPTTMSGPMQISWLPLTTGGSMVGDYLTTPYVNDKTHGVFAKAKKPTGSVLSEFMVVPTAGRPDLGTYHGPLNSWHDRPISHRANSQRFYPNF